MVIMHIATNGSYRSEAIRGRSPEEPADTRLTRGTDTAGLTKEAGPMLGPAPSCALMLRAILAVLQLSLGGFSRPVDHSSR